MAHAERNISIDRPLTDVFDFIADGMNNPLWRSSVIDIQRVAGKPLQVGAVFKQGLKGPGGRIDGDYEIVEFQTNQWIKFQVITGPARPTGSYKFEAQGNSTRVTFTLDFEAQGLAKLMEPMIASSMRSEVAMLSNLKSYLENQSK